MSPCCGSTGRNMVVMFITTAMVLVLISAAGVRAQAIEGMDVEHIPTQQPSHWNGSGEIVFREVGSDISPETELPSETQPPRTTPSLPEPSSLPIVHPQPYSSNFSAAAELQQNHTVTSRPSVNFLDPDLYLNFTLTMGRAPNPLSSIYQTIHSFQDRNGSRQQPNNSIISEGVPKTTDYPSKDSVTHKVPPRTDSTTRGPSGIRDSSTDGTPKEEDRHPCHRECIVGAPPMKCRYFFVQEWYQTMSKACYGCPLNLSHCDLEHCIAGDGVQRTIVVVNRTLPGPSIQVCLGDEVEVALENAMPEEGASLHWHGLHQRGTPHADGVPYVTQCPIAPGTTFTYRFNASTPGTHFWHSHSGLQRGDGNFGALIIRVPKEQDPHAELYDTDSEEHFMQIIDWGHSLGVITFVSHHHGNGDNKPSSILINGKGRFRPFPASVSSIDESSAPSMLPYPVEVGVRNQLTNTSFTPVAVFKVQRGVRHRFRMINAGFLNCPIQFSVDNHTLLVISSDGGDVQPVKVDSIVSYAGERFDFILIPDWPIETDGRWREGRGVTGRRKFWARFRGLMDCDERFTSAHQVAIVEYEMDNPHDGEFVDIKLLNEEDPPGEVSYAAADRQGMTFNALNVGAGADGSHSVAELKAIGMAEPEPNDPVLKPKADMTFYLGYDFYGKDNPIYHVQHLYGFQKVLDNRQRLQTPQLNHISLKMPTFPVLTQRNLLDEGGIELPEFCNETSLMDAGKNCSSQDFCHCTHLLSVPLGAVVELILIDEGVAYDANHPFHLHGHAFRVLGMGRVGPSVTVETIKALDALGYIQRRTTPFKPALKDTVTVPDGGYTVVRFHATNPGYWLFHCHLGFHVELGMALIFKVGEHSDFAPVPPKFPQCGSWTPSESEELPHYTKHNSDSTKHLEEMKTTEKEFNIIPGRAGSSFHSGSATYSHHWRLNLLLLFIIFIFSIRNPSIS